MSSIRLSNTVCAVQALRPRAHVGHHPAEVLGVRGARAKAAEPVVSRVIARRVDQRGGEAFAVEQRLRAHQRIAFQLLRAALGVEIEMATAAGEQEQRALRVMRDRKRVARGGDVVRLQRDELAAGEGGVCGKDKQQAGGFHRSLRNSSTERPASRAIPPMVNALTGLLRGMTTMR